MATLYVGNLPWTISEEELTQIFEPHAKVLSARIIKDKMSGRSRGFGFVDVDDKDVEKAVKSVNGTKLKDRDLVVNEAKPKQPRQNI